VRFRCLLPFLLAILLHGSRANALEFGPEQLQRFVNAHAAYDPGAGPIDEVLQTFDESAAPLSVDWLAEAREFPGGPAVLAEARQSSTLAADRIDATGFVSIRTLGGAAVHSWSEAQSILGVEFIAEPGDTGLVVSGDLSGTGSGIRQLVLSHFVQLLPGGVALVDQVLDLSDADGPFQTSYSLVPGEVYRLSVFFEVEEDGAEASFSFSAVVPEAPAGLLLGVGLVALTLAGRRQKPAQLA
jgi:hypothetical protein